MSWGAPPGGQALPPFRSLSWRTLLRPTTFTPPTVRQVYVKIGYVYLLDYFTFIMFIYMSFRAAQDHNMARGPGYDFVNVLLNSMGGSDGNDGGNVAAS
jgi:hypothetical protein